MVISSLLWIVYLFASRGFILPNLLMTGLLGLVFIFTSTIAGKLLGIGIARLRLALLYKQLIARYHI